MSDDKMLSKETNELDNQLTQHLRYLYNTKLDDMQSLTHIRERLLRNSKESLPVIDSLINITELPHERQRPRSPLYHAHPTWRSRASLSQRILQLVAVLLVAVITGAFAIVLTISHASLGGKTSSSLLRPGWQQVAVYSGKGNSTLTGLKRSLPSIWATSITCTGDGAVNITMAGVDTEDQQDTDSCQYPLLTLSQPTSFLYNESSTTVIQTIKVTAHATTSWQLHLLEAIHQPTFHLGAEWKMVGGTVSGGGIEFTRNGQGGEWFPQSSPTMVQVAISRGGEHMSAQTWSILTICFGSGKSHIQLSPDVGNLPLPTCDGQPKLTTLRFPKSTSVKDMNVYASGDIIWSAGIAACTNESKCQHIPALPVPLAS